VARNFDKRNLTTGDIAQLCGVNFRTVIRWIQRGHLKAFQLPGRGDNRVQVADFIQFLRDNDMPIPEELMPSARRVLIVEGDEALASLLDRAFGRAGYETKIAADGFQAGALAGSFGPGVMVVDIGTKGVDGPEAIRMIRDDARLGLAKVIALTPSSTSKKKRGELADAGADAVMDRDVKPAKLIDAIAAD
jgi:CheY-like chemotaxis protein